MKLNKLILKAINEGIEKSLMLFDDELEFGKSNLTLIANKNVKDTIWLSDNTVDLDLPSGTLWMKYNIGATCGNNKESWYGNYYAWGELKPKSEYKDKTYTYKDNPKILPLENDVAYLTNKLLRMPTHEDIQELINYTTTKWVKNYNRIIGLNGKIFTGKNGNSLFIPAAGIWDVESEPCCTSCCYLLSSSSFYPDRPDLVYSLKCDLSEERPNFRYRRFAGYTVRGVVA